MVFTSSSSRELFIYYGQGELEALAQYRRVVLQPDYYTPSQLDELKKSGTRPLAYLSLGEDPGPPAPWQRSERNPDWGGNYVQLSHPGWRNHLFQLTADYLGKGFTGLLLDTLDATELFPEDRAVMLELVRELREIMHEHYLLANRGFGLLPELAAGVDGFVFEAFSSAWQADGSYRALPPRHLLHNVRIASELQATGLDLYALDYADTEELAAFASARALTHNLKPLISNRQLTRI